MSDSISVIIPAHRESRQTLKRSLSLLEKHLAYRPHEILIVENGSEELEDITGTKYYCTEDAGLGLALKYGIMQSENENIFFLPADMSYDLSFIEFAMQETADLVIGSKRAKGSKVSRPWTSELVSAAYSAYLRYWNGLKVLDATGAKRYLRSKVLPIALQCHSTGIGFEVQLIEKMQKAGLTIKEIPVIVHDRDRGGVIRWLR